MPRISPLLLVAFVCVAGLAGCVAPQKPAAVFVQAFQVRGVVKELRPGSKTVVINHEEIPGYAPAMVTPFTAANPAELIGLTPEDTVTFQLIVNAGVNWIEQVKKLDVPKPAPTPGIEPITPPSP